jgi:hypothetical protein
MSKKSTSSNKEVGSNRMSIDSFKETTPTTPIKHNIIDTFYPTYDFNYEQQLKEVFLYKFKNAYKKQIQNASYANNCNGTTFKKQNQQLFVASYIHLKTPYRGIILWHGLGSGKTFSSILISKSINPDYKVIVVLPAMLVDNYRNELVKTQQITTTDIEEKYFYYTSNGKLNNFDFSQSNEFSNSLIVFDESQLLISKIVNSFAEGSTSAFSTFYRKLCEEDNVKLVFLSGTPIVQNATELSVLFNLLHGAKTKHISTITKSQTDIYKNSIEIIKTLLEQRHNTLELTTTSLDLIDFIKTIDIAKSSIIYKEENETVVLTFYKNPQNYINIYDAEQNYIGLKYEKNENTNEQFEKTVKKLFDKIKFERHIEYLFDNTRFKEQYSLIKPDDFKPVLYDLKYTNEMRMEQIKNPSCFRNLPIKNRLELLEKCKGMLSYFGNIQSIMPETVLLPHHKYGYDNNDTPLFNIKHCYFSDYQRETVEKLKKSHNTFEYQHLVNNIEHFVYPKHEYINTKKYYGVEMVKYVLKNIPEEEQNYVFLLLKQKMHLPTSANATTTNPTTTAKNKRKTTKTTTAKNKRKTQEKTKKTPNNDNDILASIFYKMYKKSKNRDLYNVKTLNNHEKIIVDIIKNYFQSETDVNNEKQICLIWDIEQFRDVENKDVKNALLVNNISDPTTDPTTTIDQHPLKKYSTKFYEIIDCILKNPNDLHVVYIEFLQVIIPFVRALQANNFSEFTFSGGGNTINSQNMSPPNKRQKITSSISLQINGKKITPTETEKKVVKPFIKTNKKYKQQIPQIPKKSTRKRKLNSKYYSASSQTNEQSPSIKKKYMFLTGSGTSSENISSKLTKCLQDFKEGKTFNKNEMIDKFNADENKNGQKINVVILNSAASEGITLKNVRFVHMLHPPANMSRLFQIFGRAIRTCSHSKLTEENRNVCAILYLASNKQNENDETVVTKTKDEQKFEDIVNENDANIPYLKFLKTNAIDFAL